MSFFTYNELSAVTAFDESFGDAVTNKKQVMVQIPEYSSLSSRSKGGPSASPPLSFSPPLAGRSPASSPASSPKSSSAILSSLTNAAPASKMSDPTGSVVYEVAGRSGTMKSILALYEAIGFLLSGFDALNGAATTMTHNGTHSNSRAVYYIDSEQSFHPPTANLIATHQAAAYVARLEADATSISKAPIASVASIVDAVLSKIHVFRPDTNQAVIATLISVQHKLSARCSNSGKQQQRPQQPQQPLDMLVLDSLTSNYYSNLCMDTTVALNSFGSSNPYSGSNAAPQAGVTSRANDVMLSLSRIVKNKDHGVVVVALRCILSKEGKDDLAGSGTWQKDFTRLSSQWNSLITHHVKLRKAVPSDNVTEEWNAISASGGVGGKGVKLKFVDGQIIREDVGMKRGEKRSVGQASASAMDL